MDDFSTRIDKFVEDWYTLITVQYNIVKIITRENDIPITCLTLFLSHN